MKNTRKIKFTTTESKTRLTVGKTCYQGQLRHNVILSEEETKNHAAQLPDQELDFNPDT